MSIPIIFISFHYSTSLSVPLRIFPIDRKSNRDSHKRSRRCNAREEKNDKYLSRKNSCRHSRGAQGRRTRKRD